MSKKDKAIEELTEEQALKAEKRRRKKEKKERKAQQAAASIDDSTTSPKKRKHDSAQDDAEAPSKKKTKKSQPINSTEGQEFLTSNRITLSDPSILPILSFDGLDVPEKLASAFSGFSKPTPIQACTWPPAMQGKDVVGIAETGSGKTLAFGVPALKRLISSSENTLQVLVVAPTRELAIQTHETLEKLGQPFNIASVTLMGGVPKEPQVKALKKAKKGAGGVHTRIAVGTPGRILDLANEGTCDLSNVEYLVLDEADRMLDKGFENDITKIIEKCRPSAERQTLMFSATWPEYVRRLASSFLRNPIRVTVGSEDLAANSRVEQIVEVFEDVRSKDQRLLKHLRNLMPSKAPSTTNLILIFALYKKECARIEQTLSRQGYHVSAIHGDLSQPARIQSLNNFKTGKTPLLVATDVAARGLDIPNVGVVINYTFPLQVEDYVHRIGRTGRGGRTGKSITFFTGDQTEKGLAGEFNKLLKESGVECKELQENFSMTIKKKEHGAYGAFYRDDDDLKGKKATKIVFD
ncbi:P-loop containing nucleoside triphosphate hydrolase protein [Flagelloscypha sp. PMI_526]|nr:P-loop containing nucleoside triphosphate hydrolase protein [Flagelloscypha sp. PMI_526]